MLGVSRADKGWSECGKIDIMENVGFEPTVFYQTVHSLSSVKELGKIKCSMRVNMENAFTDFHVFALEWYSERLDFFIDGQKFLTYERREDKPQFYC